MAIAIIRSFQKVVVHHSASTRDTSYAEIRDWHLSAPKNFREIGYHYVILGDAETAIGRPLPEMGAHVRGKNRTSIGICVVGDNTSLESGWTLSQIISLNRLVVALRRVFPDVVVLGHRDLANTACPGLEIHDVIDE